MSEVEGIREILRALAEARDGPFYSLWVELTYRVRHPLPRIEFRIYQAADSAETLLSVWVSATRPDGIEVGWSVGLETTPRALIIWATVDFSDDQGSHEVLELYTETQDAGEAAAQIGVYAGTVCAERDVFGEDVDDLRKRTQR